MELDLTLFLPGDGVLVALSGGADSLALLHALRELRAEWRFRLGAVHLHHGMRGEEADADVAYLTQLCADWDVPLAVEHADVPALARQRGLGIEEAGREARYAAFGRACETHGFQKVATAHHADDQAESVLLNLFRGSGLDGLTGIPRRRPLVAGGDSVVVRPLLSVTRSEIEAYGRRHGLTPLFDRTNNDPRFLRNRVRKEVLPLLEALDPAVRHHLTRLSAQVREELEVLEPAALALLHAAERPPRTTWVHRAAASPGPRLVVKGLIEAPAALARRAVRHYLRKLRAKVEITEAVVDRVLAVARGELSAVELPGGFLRLRLRDGMLQPQPLRVELSIPEPVSVAETGITRAPEFELEFDVQTVLHPVSGPQPPERALLAASSLMPPFCVRPPKRGDRFRPLGAPGARLLSDLLAERCVPTAERPYWPLLCDQSGIVWVVGHVIAERARVSAGSGAGIQITASRNPG